MTGVVTRDSAQRRPSDKHRSDARSFLLIADRLSPARPTGLPLCRAVPASPPPDPRPGRRRGHSALCTNAALVHSISTENSTEIAPHSRLVLENAGQASNQATVASVTAFETALLAHQVAARQPVAHDETPRFDDNHRTVRGVLAAFLVSPGQRWPEVPFRPSPTSPTPTTPCHPSAPQRSGGGASAP